MHGTVAGFYIVHCVFSSRIITPQTERINELNAAEAEKMEKVAIHSSSVGSNAELCYQSAYIQLALYIQQYHLHRTLYVLTLIAIFI